MSPIKKVLRHLNARIQREKSRWNNWQNFGFRLLLEVGVPFIPIFFEYVFTGKVQNYAFVLFVTMFVIGKGTSSRMPIIFALGIVSGLVFSMAYGALFLNNINPLPFLPPSFIPVILSAKIALGFFVFTHVLELFQRYVINGEIPPPFNNNQKT